MIVNLATIGMVWPEVILIVIATWIYLGGTFSPGRMLWASLSMVTYGVALWVLLFNEGPLWVDLAGGTVGLNGPLILDYLGQMGRYLCLLFGLLFTLVASRAGTRRLATELLGSIMMLVAGMMLVCRANDLVFLFVSLELISIPTYILLFLGRRNRDSAEATTKYFFLSILASALLLYGMAFFYGLANGSTLIIGGHSTEGIQRAIHDLSAEKLSLYVVGLILVVSGLGFKITAVPFHFYAADVYQGTTNLNAGVLAVAPKIAGMIALIRLVAMTVPANLEIGWQVVLVLALLTMTLGNVCALWQTNIRRLMAYSSIAHAGYMLIGLAVYMAAAQFGGISALVFYLAVYALASFGTFAVLAYLGDEEREVDQVSELAGLGWTRPWAAAALAICMFSLAGIPPLAGFWGKLTLFTSAIRVSLAGEGMMSGWFLVLAIVGVINAAIAAAYYLRVVSILYFQPQTTAPPARGGVGALAGTFVCTLLVFVLGLSPGAALRNAELAEPGVGRSQDQLNRSPLADLDYGERIQTTSMADPVGVVLDPVARPRKEADRVARSAAAGEFRQDSHPEE